MIQGDTLTELYDVAAGDGPAADECRAILAERPPLTMGETIAWDGFTDLDSTRPPAMAGRTAIPWNIIVQYAQWNGMRRDEADRFIQQIMAMDRVFVNSKSKNDDHGDK